MGSQLSHSDVEAVAMVKNKHNYDKTAHVVGRLVSCLTFKDGIALSCLKLLKLA